MDVYLYKYDITDMHGQGQKRKNTTYSKFWLLQQKLQAKLKEIHRFEKITQTWFAGFCVFSRSASFYKRIHGTGDFPKTTSYSDLCFG